MMRIKRTVHALLFLFLVSPLFAQFEHRGMFTVDGNVHSDFAGDDRVRTGGIVRIGDMNGDSMPDIAFAVVELFGNPEGIIIVSGSDGSFIRKIDSPYPNDFIDFGTTIIGLPDVNGDGVDDLYVVATNQLNGAAYLVSGADGNIIGGELPPYGQLQHYDIANQSVDLGDVDGDGGKWFAYNCPNEYAADPNSPQGFATDVGAVYVMKATPGGGVSTINVLRGVAQDQRFGTSLSSIGDVNGDGQEDIFVVSQTPFQVGGVAYSAAIYDIVTGALLRGQSSSLVVKLDDVNADGFDDYQDNGNIVSGFDGSVLYPTGGSGFLKTCGDINGDSVEDYAIDSSFRSGADGSSLIDASAPFPTLVKLLGDGGDVDGDGFEDGVYVHGFYSPIPGANLRRIHHIYTVSACGAKNYDEALGGLQTLELNWVAGGQSDPAIGTITVGGANPGGLGLMSVSLARANFPYFGLDVLVDPNPANFVMNVGFGYDLAGELTAPAYIGSPFVAGVSFFFQAFQTFPSLACSNGLEIRFVP